MQSVRYLQEPYLIQEPDLLIDVWNPATQPSHRSKVRTKTICLSTRVRRVVLGEREEGERRVHCIPCKNTRTVLATPQALNHRSQLRTLVSRSAPAGETRVRECVLTRPTATAFVDQPSQPSSSQTITRAPGPEMQDLPHAQATVQLRRAAVPVPVALAMVSQSCCSLMSPSDDL